MRLTIDYHSGLHPFAVLPPESSLPRLLHLEASPRYERSYSSRLAAAFLEVYRAANPDDTIDHLHLFDHQLPDFDQEAANQKMEHIASLIRSGEGIEPVGKWAAVLEQIERLKAADKVLLSSPMWNYSIPYRLKQYIDIVVQPALTFYVNRKGEYVGLLKNRSMQMLLSSGSEYRMRFPHEDDGTKTDFQRAYLEHMARFIGFKDIRVVKMQPSEDAGPEDVARIFEEKLEEAREAARKF